MAAHGPPFGSKRETGFPRPAHAPADFACEVCQHARSDKRGVGRRCSCNLGGARRRTSAGVQKRTEVLFADLPRVITYRFMPQPSNQHFDRRPLSREEKDRWKAAQAEEGRL